MRELSFPYPNQEKEEQSLALACCMARAREVSGQSGESPLHDIYWYTREACYPVSRRLGLTWTGVIRKLDLASSFSREKVVELSSPFWYEVVHPDVLAREVMES